jgi:hypothetical protein
VILSVNVSSSIPFSASPSSSFPGLRARHSACLSVPVFATEPSIGTCRYSDANGLTLSPPTRAERGNHAGTAKILINDGAKVDHQTSRGHTAPYAGSAVGCADVVMVLFGAGAIVNIRGWTVGRR